MIFDLDDNPLSSAQLSLIKNAAETFTIRIECRMGYFLRVVAANLNLQTEARIEGANLWTNLETGGLALSPWAGTRRNFEIRLTNDTNQTARENLALRVSR